MSLENSDPSTSPTVPASTGPQRQGAPEPVAIEPRRPKPRGHGDLEQAKESPGLMPATQRVSVAGTAETNPSATATDQASSETPQVAAPQSFHPEQHRHPVQARITSFELKTPGANAGRRSPPPEPGSGFSVVLILLAGVVVVGLLFTVGNLAYDRGLSEGIKVGSAPKPSAPVPPSLASELESAIENLGAGNAPAALGKLQKLNEEDSRAPLGSLKYLVARAALEAGDIESARVGICESILGGERVSDSVAMLAMLDLAPEGPQGDLDLARGKLREAIALDFANSRPHIELARIARAHGDVETARSHLQQAAALLDPMENSDIIEVAETLLELEVLPDDGLPEAAHGRMNVGRRWGAAYLALRKGDVVAAASLLGQCREEHPPEVFREILNDPAFARFAGESPLSDLINQSGRGR